MTPSKPVGSVSSLKLHNAPLNPANYAFANTEATFARKPTLPLRVVATKQPPEVAITDTNPLIWGLISLLMAGEADAQT